MNQKFIIRLNEYLESECSDYGLEFSWTWQEDMDCFEVEIKRENYTQYIKTVYFKYNEDKDDLEIELTEDCFYVTREFDQTVKYFWMLVAPRLFPD